MLCCVELAFLIFQIKQIKKTMNFDTKYGHKILEDVQQMQKMESEIDLLEIVKRRFTISLILCKSRENFYRKKKDELFTTLQLMQMNIARRKPTSAYIDHLYQRIHQLKQDIKNLEMSTSESESNIENLKLECKQIFEEIEQIYNNA